MSRSGWLEDVVADGMLEEGVVKFGRKGVKDATGHCDCVGGEEVGCPVKGLWEEGDWLLLREAEFGGGL